MTVVGFIKTDKRFDWLCEHILIADNIFHLPDIDTYRL